MKKLFGVKNISKKVISAVLVGSMVAAMATGCGSSSSGDASANTTLKLTNVSYDPTRELYEEYNKAFAAYYEEKYGQTVELVQSHGGSGSQARSVVEGAEADVVTLALAHDITLIEQNGLIDEGWISEFDKNSSPYTSTIVFLVRKGNEKGINDWEDLTKEGVEVITPDPKSSGGACWNFLAAWHYADLKFGGDEEQIKAFESALYNNVTVMDSGARGATTTFVENGQGDVLIAWENEAIATLAEYPDEYEIVSPSVSILAEPSVAIVDENANKNGTQELAKEYIEYLYSDEAQEIIGEKGYRPSNEEILAKYADKFDLSMELCTIDDFGGWDQAYEDFFKDGAIFDEIYAN
ncbi:MAG: sulfate ABC transporter substrate-binding protein [Butyrivibrio sp.]|nr:sulfate ABC transporter substrate-binding protein [Butyrivibrio sp.]